MGEWVGKICKIDGDYRSSCVHNIRIFVMKGMTFPPCRQCEEKDMSDPRLFWHLVSRR